MQSVLPSSTGKDRESPSHHFEWHMQFFNQKTLNVHTSLAPNNAKQVLFLFLLNASKLFLKSLRLLITIATHIKQL